jgi:hypothetical protein
MTLNTLIGRLRRPAVGAALGAVLFLCLTACGGSNSPTSDQPSAADSQGARAGGPRTRQPGVSGKIAAIDGKTLQVQSSQEQTAVTYTGRTTFTEVQTVTSAALKTGVCATVRAGGATASPSATGQITADTVALSAAVHGSCVGGFGGAGARRPGAPSAAPSDQPSGAPGGRPSGGPEGARGFGTAGRVVATNGSTFVVNDTLGAGGVATKVTVTTTNATIWTEVSKTSAKSLAVGRCAFAVGPASSSGAVTASSIRLSKAAADGTCTAGLGRLRDGQGRGRGGQPTGAPTNG